MRHADWFSGFGGGTLAAKSAGLQTVGACEIDANAISVYRRHFPDVPMFVDITKPHDWPACDVVTFGSPCQDTSIAGLRKGLAGKRSGLFYAAIDVIRRLRERDGGPRWAVWEQPLGVFSTHNGRDFAAVLDSFLDIGARDISWRVLDAQYFGVPQRRRRVFLVADFGGECADPVFSFLEGVRGHPQTGREAGQRTAALSASGAGTSRTGNSRTECEMLIPTCARRLRAQSQMAHRDDADTLIPARSQTSRNYRIDAETENLIASPLTAGSAASNGVNAPGRRREDDFNLVIAHPLTADGHDVSEDGTGRGTPLVVFDWQSGGDVRHNASERRSSGLQASQTPAVMTPMAVRRLTPTECERLMHVSDGYTESGIDGPLSDSARYRILGNGLVWTCLAPILKAITETRESHA